MANYNQLMIIARQQSFQDRIKYAIQKAAIDVMAEDGATPGHALRIAYAKTILAGSASVFEYAIAVLTNATVATGVDIGASADGAYGVLDSVLPFTINSFFNAFAGVAN